MENEKELVENTLNVDDISSPIDTMDADTLNVLSSLGVNFDDSGMIVDTVKDEEVSASAPKEQVPTIDLNIDKPHFTMDKKELIKALKYAVIMIKKPSNDKAASCLNLIAKEDGLHAMFKDNMTYVDIKLATDNTDNFIEGVVSLKHKSLANVLMGADSKIVIYKSTVKNNENSETPALYIRLKSGDFLLLDSFMDVKPEALESSATQEATKMFDMDTGKVKVMCDVLLPLIASAQDPACKVANIYDDRVLLKSGSFLLQMKGSFANLRLTKKEIELLRTASSDSVGTIAMFNKLNINNENIVKIEVGDIKITSIVSIPVRDESTISRLAPLDTAKYSVVNTSDFITLLKLSKSSLNYLGTVSMNYSKEGHGLDVMVNARDGHSNLYIDSINSNDLQPMDKPALVYSAQLLGLAKSFERGNDLEVSFLTDGLALRDQTLGIEAEMIYTNK